MNPTKNSEAKHTPGPWHIAYYGPSERVIVKHGQQSIADVRGCELDDSTSHAKANARLIAAAPELLEALGECERRMSRIACGEISGVAAKHSAKSGLETIRAAIAKAAGGAL